MKFISKTEYNAKYSHEELIDSFNPFTGKTIENKQFFYIGDERIYVLSPENYKIATGGNDFINR
jgi:hypothetical protein